MPVIKTSYSIENSITVTGLASLGSSTTAGWSSDYISNLTDKYLDAVLNVVLDPANTAPANDRAFYLFVWGAQNTSDMPTTGASSGGTVGVQGGLTFPTITDRQQLPFVVIPYIAQDVVVRSRPISVCNVLGVNTLPPYWGVALLNYSGAALAASGHSIKWRGVHLTS